MGHFILLTGEPRSGKTTIIRHIVSSLDSEISGFFALEILEDGERKGFRMVTTTGEERILAHVDIVDKYAPRVGKYGVDLSALNFIVTRSLENALGRGMSIFVVDEIGPMEILSSKFCSVIETLLEKDVFVIGTIVKRSCPFTDNVKKHPNVKLIDVSKDNQQSVFQKVLKLLMEMGVC